MIRKLFNQLGIAIKSYSYSFDFVFSKKPKWLIIPALANFILLLIVVSAAILYADEVITWIFGMLSLSPPARLTLKHLIFRNNLFLP